jgi:hypothetical protein
MGLASILSVLERRRIRRETEHLTFAVLNPFLSSSIEERIKGEESIALAGPHSCKYALNPFAGYV